jgi:DNA-directed RNA polymerase subunit RPC12/RpoP
MVFHFTVNAKIVLMTFAIIALFALGTLYALAATVQQTTTRLTIAAIMFLVGFGLAFYAYYLTRKPKTVIQRLEVSGQMKAVPLRCPNCSASVDASVIKIVSGVPYATCPYCGHTFEVAEEPKW